MGTAAVLLALVLSGARASGGEAVRFTTRPEGDGNVIVGENTDSLMAWHGTVSFPKLVNLRPSVRVPFRFVLAPATKRDMLTLTPVNRTKATEMSVSYRFARGDPGAKPDPAAVYVFPWEHGTKVRVDQGYFGPTTHRNMRALDFAIPEGATVCAARDGIVVATKDDSDRGGPSALYDADANFVDILHADGTWANYAHLQLRGVLVRPGESVKAGQPIGRCGHTGRASGPHLHFAVFRATWESEGGEAIPTVFMHVDGKAVEAGAARTYYSVHPGGPPFEAVLAERMSDADFDGVTRTASATGKVTILEERVDDKVFLWCRNGMGSAQAVTVSFRRLSGFRPSKEVPLVRRVPALTEAYLLSLVHTGRPGAATYEITYSWRRAKP